MKTTLTSKGWNEVKTTNVEITSIPDRNPIITVKAWIESNKRLKLDRKRKTCNCCKRPWSGLEGGVNLIFTTKANKAVCDMCLIELKKSNEKSEI